VVSRSESSRAQKVLLREGHGGGPTRLTALGGGLVGRARVCAVTCHVFESGMIKMEVFAFFTFPFGHECKLSGGFFSWCTVLLQLCSRRCWFTNIDLM